MKVLLTGGKGFIGSHLRAAFWQRDYDVTVIDLADGNDALDFFRTDDTRFDLAIHAAAIVGGRKTIDGSPLAIATNLALDAYFFRWLQRTKTDRAVYFSSSAAYPVELQTSHAPRRLEEHETMLGTPDSVYGWAKRTGVFLADYLDDCELFIPQVMSGYCDTTQSLDYPFPSFVERAKRRADPFEIWGSGEQVRDWVHVSDVIAAILTAIDEGVTGTCNIATGRGVSFNTLAQMMAEEVGYSPDFHHVIDAPMGVHTRVGDPTKMRTFFEPKVTLEEGIAKAFAS